MHVAHAIEFYDYNYLMYKYKPFFYNSIINFGNNVHTKGTIPLCFVSKLGLLVVTGIYKNLSVSTGMVDMLIT